MRPSCNGTGCYYEPGLSRRSDPARATRLKEWGGQLLRDARVKPDQAFLGHGCPLHHNLALSMNSNGDDRPLAPSTQGLPGPAQATAHRAERRSRVPGDLGVAVPTSGEPKDEPLRRVQIGHGP